MTTQASRLALAVALLPVLAGPAWTKEPPAPAQAATTRPAMALEASLDSGVMDAEGKLALLYSKPRYGSDERQPAIALLDLAAGKVLLQRRWADPVQAAAIFGDMAYLSPQESNEVQIRQLKDLSVRKKISAGARVRHLAVLDGQVLVVQTEEGYKFLRLADQKFTDEFFPPASRERQAMTLLERRVGEQVFDDPLGSHVDGFQVDWAVYGPDLKLRAILVPEKDDFGGSGPRGGLDYPLGPWNRLLHEQDGVMTPSGQRLGAIECQRRASMGHRDMTILAHHPVAAVLTEVVEESVNNLIPRRLILCLHELQSAQEIATVPLESVRLAHEDYTREREARQPFLLSGGRTLLCVGRTHAYAHTIPQELLRKFPAPLAIVLPGEVPILPAGAKTVLAHQVRGDKSGLKFKLVKGMDGLTIDASSGSVTAEGPWLLRAARPEVEGLLAHFRRGQERETKVEQVVDQLCRTRQELYKPLLARTPAGLAFPVPIRIEVQNDRQEKATRGYVALLDVDKPSLVKLGQQIKARGRGGFDRDDR